MTNIQVAYQKAQEEARHNREMEKHNVVSEKQAQKSLELEAERQNITKGQYSDTYGYEPGQRPYSVSRYQLENMFGTARDVVSGIRNSIDKAKGTITNVIGKLFKL